MKRCPICKIEKDLSEFDRYFSKTRNKFRVGNYCKECRKVESLKVAKGHYKKNREAKKKYAKKYRKENTDKVKENKRKYLGKKSRELQNSYIKDLLKSSPKIPNEFINDNPEIIETKRLQLKIKRRLKNLKHAEK